MLTPLEFETLLTSLMPLVPSVSSAVRAIYESSFSVGYKVGDDPITEADREASRQIVAHLRSAFPKDLVISEEEEATGADRTQSRIWWVDPIDGTRDFVLRNGEFVTMIGLSIGGRAAFGLVFSPLSESIWVGAPGAGAYRIEKGVRTPLHVTTTAAFSSFRMVVSRSREERAKPYIAALAPEHVRVVGSAGLKAMAVADGTAELYLQPDRGACLWDSCGPEAIAVAAGGSVTDFDGATFDYRSRPIVHERGMVFSNGAAHARVLETVKRIEAECARKDAT